MRFFKVVGPVFFSALFSAETAAQTTQLPRELSGRWTLAAANRTQTFSLDEITVKDQLSFTAKLTWWAVDPKCTIRSELLEGRITPTGIAFDAKTKCDVSFTAELSREPNSKGWAGKAFSTSGTRVELDLKAN